MATENTPETLPAEDEFSAAFASLTSGETPLAETPPAETPPAETPPAETPPAETPPAETPEQIRIRELETALAEAKKTPVAAAPVVDKPVEAPPLYTDDETASIAKYHKDWPDIAQAEALVRRKEYAEVVGHIFNEIQKAYGPVLEYYQTRSGRDQYTDILGLVPDYDAIRDKAVAWATADTQPAYLKTAFAKVIESGSADEVADLVARFKKETNYVAPASASPAATPAATSGGAVVAPKTPTVLTEAAKKAAAKLSVVQTSRSVQTEGPDPNDFDAAFAEATSQRK